MSLQHYYNIWAKQWSRWAKEIAIKAAGAGRGIPVKKNYGENSNSASTTAMDMHRAITKVLETVFFTFGNLKDAAEFKKRKTTLIRYVLKQAWRGSGLASQAMDKMADQKIAKLVKPEKGKREPSDPEYAMECSDYMMD